jgi:hypothetical protein
MGDLLSSLPGSNDWRDIAYVGYFDGDTGLAQGFAEAAEAILAAFGQDQATNDRLLLPVIYNYRHALELSLKQAIREAARRLRFGGHGCVELDPKFLDNELKAKQRHRLGPLAKQLVELLAQLNIEYPAKTVTLLERLHQLDPHGEAFRYAGRLHTTAKHVDVPRLVGAFREAFDIIHWGLLLGELQVYADYQYDMHNYCSDPFD